MVFMMFVISCKQDKDFVNTSKNPINQSVKTGDIKFPFLNGDTNLKALKNTVEKTINAIDSSLSKFNSKDIEITYDGVNNIPTTIWYQNGKPIKIKHGVAEETGEINGYISYYLDNGKIWFVDNEYTKAIFQNQQLKYWYWVNTDKDWVIQDAPKEHIILQEKDILTTINHIINEVKSLN